MSGADVTYWLSALVLILGVGALNGVMLGFFGVGGGTVTPALMFQAITALSYSDDTAMRYAVGSALAATAVLSARALWAGRRRGALEAAALWRWGPFAAVGAALGAGLTGWADARWLMAGHGAVAVGAALWIAYGQRTQWAAPGLLAGGGAAALAGLASGATGVGGGTFGAPALRAVGRPSDEAGATAAGFGLAIAAPGALAAVAAGLAATPEPAPTIAIGYVDAPMAILFIVLGVVCAPIGVQISRAMKPGIHSVVLAMILALTGFSMLREAVL